MKNSNKIIAEQDSVYALEYSAKRNTYSVNKLYDSLKTNFLRHIRGKHDDWVILQIGDNKEGLIGITATLKEKRHESLRKACENIAKHGLRSDTKKGDE